MSDFTYDAYTEDGEEDTTTTININDIDDIYSLVQDDENENAGLPSLTYDTKVYQAYVDLHYGLPDDVTELEELVDRADEAYAGEHTSWAAFAEQTAEELYELPTHWPFNNIDWDAAGEDLKQDYSENENHYFRDM